jgi:hypothetical protein
MARRDKFIYARIKSAAFYAGGAAGSPRPTALFASGKA